jgi:hypothetical protein
MPKKTLKQIIQYSKRGRNGSRQSLLKWIRVQKFASIISIGTVLSPSRSKTAKYHSLDSKPTALSEAILGLGRY